MSNSEHPTLTKLARTTNHRLQTPISGFRYPFLCGSRVCRRICCKVERKEGLGNSCMIHEAGFVIPAAFISYHTMLEAIISTRTDHRGVA